MCVYSQMPTKTCSVVPMLVSMYNTHMHMCIYFYVFVCVFFCDYLFCCSVCAIVLVSVGVMCVCDLIWGLCVGGQQGHKPSVAKETAKPSRDANPQPGKQGRTPTLRNQMQGHTPSASATGTHTLSCIALAISTDP